MKRIIIILGILALCSTSFAQSSAQNEQQGKQKKGFPVIVDLVQLEDENENMILEIFNMPSDSLNRYYLDVGMLGFGDEIVQLYFDPAHALYLPLGNTLEQAQNVLNEMKGLFSTEPGTYMFKDGCLAFGFPSSKLEPVKITYHKELLGKSLEFSVEREGYIRATYVSKSNLGSILTSLKLYRKMHPREK